MVFPKPVLTINDTESVYTLLRYSNNSAEGILASTLLFLVIFPILFVGAIVVNKRVTSSWVFASFVCSILGILFVLMELMSKEFMFFLFLMTAGGLVWAKLSGPKANI